MLFTPLSQKVFSMISDMISKKSHMILGMVSKIQAKKFKTAT